LRPGTVTEYDIEPAIRLVELTEMDAKYDLEDELVVLKSSSPEIPTSPHSQGPPTIFNVKSILIYLR